MLLKEQKTDCRYLASIGGIDYSVNIYHMNSLKPNVVIYNSKMSIDSPIRFSGDLSDLAQLGELIKEILGVAEQGAAVTSELI